MSRIETTRAAIADVQRRILALDLECSNLRTEEAEDAARWDGKGEEFSAARRAFRAKRSARRTTINEERIRLKAHESSLKLKLRELNIDEARRQELQGAAKRAARATMDAQRTRAIALILRGIVRASNEGGDISSLIDDAVFWLDTFPDGRGASAFHLARIEELSEAEGAARELAHRVPVAEAVSEESR